MIPPAGLKYYTEAVGLDQPALPPSEFHLFQHADVASTKSRARQERPGVGGS